MSQSYPNIEAFYAERGGARSGELDFGAWWVGERRGLPSRWPHYRVSLVHDTGDVYAISFDDRQVLLLANLEGVPCDGGLNHEWGCVYHRAEGLLAGWAEKQRDLSWIREQLAVAS